VLVLDVIDLSSVEGLAQLWAGHDELRRQGRLDEARACGRLIVRQSIRHRADLGRAELLARALVSEEPAHLHFLLLAALLEAVGNHAGAAQARRDATSAPRLDLKVERAQAFVDTLNAASAAELDPPN
jgi:hypothetical protein